MIFTIVSLHNSLATGKTYMKLKSSEGFSYVGLNNYYLVGKIFCRLLEIEPGIDLETVERRAIGRSFNCAVSFNGFSEILNGKRFHKIVIAAPIEEVK